MLPAMAPDRRWLALERGEAAPVALAFVAFFCLLAATYVLRPMRDALGIDAGVHTFHWLFTGTFAATLILYPLLGVLATRTTRTRFALSIYAVVTVSLLGFRLAMSTEVDHAVLARAFFIWVSVFNVVLVSVFWGVMADAFDRGQAGRLFGAIAAGGTAGALAGPLLSRLLAARIGLSGLVLIAAGLIATASVCLVALRHRSGRHAAAAPVASQRSEPPIGGPTWSGLTRVARSRYLGGIALYVALLTATATVLYFQQGWIVEAAGLDRARRTELFATLDLATNLLTLGVQLVVTRRLLGRFGPVAGLLVLPAVTLVALAGLALSPLLAVLVLGQIARRASEHGLARPSREVLFTLVPREDKFKAKNVIDVVVYRGSDAASGWGMAGLAGAGLGVVGTALVALPLAAAWIPLAIGLGRAEARRRRIDPPEEQAA
jgi:ATP:ADP antiporter, AAA family